MPQPSTIRAANPYAALTPSGVRAALLRAVVAVVLGGALVVHAHAQQGWQETSGAVTGPDGGQIYIAGPGDRTGSDAARMTAMMQAPGSARAVSAASAPPSPAAALAPAVAAPARPAVPAGMITIPGPGERPAANAAGDAASAPKIVTIPAPGVNALLVDRAAMPGANAPLAVRPAMPGATAPIAVRAAAPGATAPIAVRVAAPALERVNVAASAAAARVAPVVVNAAPADVSGAAGANPLRNRVVAVAAANAAAPANTVSTVSTVSTVNTANNAAAAAAQPPVPPGQQDGESVHAAALAYLQQQSAGLPGHVTVTVAPVFPRGLAACTSLEPFLPPGARTWGRTTVGVRCIGERPWTLYVQARVAVEVTYFMAGRPIAPGETLAATDLQPREGDLASLPRTVITDPSQAVGAVSLVRIAAGLPLRTDMLRSASSVVIGQTVRLVASGPSFTISTEGSVLNNAAPGQQVQVRTVGGQIVTGVVKDAGTVQVQI
ncbi:MAG TPA: flagellar basal body P-ring formation chaperone FlgA [Paraburkholderia sp.]|nr:flagellar basal body P-ring formation chaperone FlgA [Paraburkholderia sp.]